MTDRAAKIKSRLIKKIWNMDVQRSSMQMDSIFALIQDNNLKRCKVLYVPVCITRDGQASPHSLKEQSSTIWFLIFLKWSQTWTHQCEKMAHITRCAFSSLRLTRCKLFQRWKRLDMVTHMQRLLMAEGDVSIPDNLSLMDFKKWDKM